GQGLVTAAQYARTSEEARDLLRMLAEHSFEDDLEETLAYWRGWSAQCRYDGTYQDAVLRSALALKLCTFEPTGAIVASPTTSLPEGVGGVRNWDYRYTWLRDSSFTLDALERLGYSNEARDYFHFLHDLQIKNGADIRIMYGILGESDGKLEEQTLDHLEGYRGSRPVRIGNGACRQRQLDIYGELLDCAFRYVLRSGFHQDLTHRPVHDLRGLAILVADYVAEHWQDTDRGIWEVRGEPRPFVYSRAMCWVAMDRAIVLAKHHGHERHVRRWVKARDAIRADVLEHGYDQQLATFVQSYGSNVLDAANLRLPLSGFLPWDDPRITSTIENTDRVLSADHALVFRYRTDIQG
ncbi:MAG: glycoside hydrolase family 15 protein, partial [Ktedonobacterales bacterium]